jgi:hypothetical protein
LPNYNPVGVSTSTAGQDFGAHAAALFTKPSNNKENHEDKDHVSDTQSNHGSGIPDLDNVDPGLEVLSQDWDIDLLEGSFATPMQDGGNSGVSDTVKRIDDAYASASIALLPDSSKETKVRLCSIWVNHGGHDK